MTLFALLLGFALQEPYPLAVEPRPGQRFTTVSITEMRLSRESRVSTFRHERTAHTHLLDVVDGRPLRKVVEVVRDIEERTSDDQSQSIENPLHQKTVTVTWNDHQPTFHAIDLLSVQDKEWLAHGERSLQFLPKQPVCVGDTWELAGKDLDPGVLPATGATEGRLTFRWNEVRDARGFITLSADLQSGTKEATLIKLSLEGELIYALDQKVLTSVKGAGKIVLTSHGKEIGQGTLSFEVTTTVKEN